MSGYQEPQPLLIVLGVILLIGIGEGGGKKMKWFKHDTDASNDSKLKKLINRHGLAGYGFYFLVIELMTRDIEANLSEIGFLPKEWDIEALEIESRLTPDTLGTLLDYMVSIGLFKRIDERIYNDKVINRCDEYTQKLIKKADPQPQSPDSVPTLSRHSPEKNALDIDIDKEEIKIKKKIEIRTEEDKNKYSSLDGIREVDLLEISNYYKVPISFVKSKHEDLINYCGSKGKKYKNYRLALMDWVKKDALKIRKEEHGKSKITIITPDPSWQTN